MAKFHSTCQEMPTYMAVSRLLRTISMVAQKEKKMSRSFSLLPECLSGHEQNVGRSMHGESHFVEV